MALPVWALSIPADKVCITCVPQQVCRICSHDRVVIEVVPIKFKHQSTLCRSVLLPRVSALHCVAWRAFVGTTLPRFFTRNPYWVSMRPLQKSIISKVRSRPRSACPNLRHNLCLSQELYFPLVHFIANRTASHSYRCWSTFCYWHSFNRSTRYCSICLSWVQNVCNVS